MFRTVLCLAVLAPLAAAADLVAPELRDAMSAAGPGERVAAYLVMDDQLSLEQVQAATRGLHRKPLRAAVAKLLQEHAAQSQVEVQAVLGEGLAQGLVGRVDQLWMGNAMMFEAEPSVIETLAALPGVNRVRLQPQWDPKAMQDSGPGGAQPAALPAPVGGQVAGVVPQPNLVQLQAPFLWDLGYDGDGVLICNLDTGTFITHPDLVNRVWNNPGEVVNGVDDDGNGKADDLHGWDFASNNNDVTSVDPHGTNTAGIICGDGSSGVNLTGMAPGATMMVAQMSSESNFLLGQQYALLMGVDCLTSSNSFKWPFFPKPDYHLDRQICDMELAAEIIHSNSIGNQGQLTGSGYPIPFNIATPGNCPSPFAYPGVAVGARSSVLGCGGLELSDSLYLDSGKGPAAWDDITQYDGSYPWTQNPAYWTYPYGGFGGPGPGLVKPDVMTYTNVITTTFPSFGTYTTFGGTSAATPHLGGALCLLIDVQPNAAPRHIAGAIELTALDKGTPGKDNTFGTGKLRTAVAARRLLLLGRFDTQTPAPGSTVTLDLFGPPNEPVYAFVSPTIFDDPVTSWNLSSPFFFFGVMPLDGAGQFSAALDVPPDAALAGVTAWLQFGCPNHLTGWGNGPLMSVPESITITP